MDVKTYLKKKRTVVESALRRMLPGGAPRLLERSIRYSLFSPGKRLRPILTLAACEALGGKQSDALPAACALEMIHTYSLIHDDLPAMDDDDYRRGRLSNHKMFDEATAILAGDALQAAAFETITKRVKHPKVAAAMVQELAHASGGAGMVGGQILDLADNAKIHDIHTMKTAALFRAATRLGALAARAKKTSLLRLTTFGFQIGLAFQYVDDILDGDRDLRTARTQATKSTQLALKAVSFLGRRGKHLNQIAENLVHREQ